MSRRSEALRIVESPHREIPADLERYQGPEEVTNCRHCAFRAQPLFEPGEWCSDPRIDGTGLVKLTDPYSQAKGLKLRRAAVTAGKCPGYRPSLRTRIARVFGLRKPVLR